MNELSTVAENAVVGETRAPMRRDESLVSVRASSAQIMRIVAEIATNPSADVAKMQALLDMQERLSAREAELAFNRDYALALAEMPKVAKRGKKDMGTKGVIPYETYEDLDAAIRPIENKYGFARSFSTRISDKGAGVVLVLRLAHREGHSITSERYCPPDPGPGRNDTQAIGSGESYGRRYLTKSMWNIVTIGEDDDGNTAEQLTQDQWAKLNDMVSILSGAETNAFLKYMRLSDLKEIRPGDYDRAIEALSAKLREKQRNKAAK